MNISDLIQDINTIQLESSVAVCESVISMIDKLELINEYSVDEELNDVIMESMLWFMESKNQKRDKTPRNEISKWMEEKGYWYTGDNPKKKKECMRMYHFLQQHKFDPKDGTYESDIKLKNGSNKRIKFSINIGTGSTLTSKDKVLLQKIIARSSITDKNGKKIVDYMDIDINNKKEMELISKIEANAALQNGENSYYDPDNDEIVMAAKLLKGKQDVAQFIFKHEEGHAFETNSKSGDSENKQQLKNIKRQASNHNTKMRNRGIGINNHDVNSSEGFADAYSTTHSEKRTAGNKKRKLTSSEIKNVFLKLDNMMNKTTHAKDISVDLLRKKLEYVNDILSDTDHEVIRKTVVNKHSIEIYMRDRAEVVSQIKYISDNIWDTPSKNDLDVLTDKGNQAILEHNMKLCQYFDDIIDILEDMMDYGISKTDQINTLHKKIDKINNDLKKNLNDLENKNKRINVSRDTDNTVYLQNFVISPDDVISAMDAANNNRKEAFKILAKKIRPILKRWKKKLESCIDYIEKDFNKLKEFKNLSTKVRYDFAKQFIKEYFDELYDGYLFYE